MNQDFKTNCVNAPLVGVCETDVFDQVTTSGALTTFNWIPGYAGTAQDNIFTTWTDLYAVLNQTNGMRTINFDPRSGGTFVIPPGSYDMTSVRWFGDLGIFDGVFPADIPVTIQDGVTLQGLTEIRGPIGIDYQGTTAPCMVFDLSSVPGANVLQLDNTASLSCSGSQPFISYQNAGSGQLVMGFGSRLFPGATPCVEVLVGATLGVQMGLQIGLAADTIQGIGTINLNMIDDSGLNAFLLAVFPFDAATQFPAVTGTISFNDLTSRPKSYRAAGAPTATDDSDAGWKEGDMWQSTTGSGAEQATYILQDDTVGAAVWGIVVQQIDATDTVPNLGFSWTYGADYVRIGTGAQIAVDSTAVYLAVSGDINIPVPAGSFSGGQVRPVLGTLNLPANYRMRGSNGFNLQFGTRCRLGGGAGIYTSALAEAQFNGALGASIEFRAYNTSASAWAASDPMPFTAIIPIEYVAP
jgi:hypothetical protein